MKYYSTSRQSPVVNFKEATIKGQAPDKSLYFPESIPVIDKKLIANIENISMEEIAFEVIRPYIANEIPEEKLREIVKETLDFPIPLVKITDLIFSLELFHGPTLAFKDIGARFMSRCLGYFVKNEPGKITVLVATSGDTGGAVANGFYDVTGVEVIILYPSGKVSTVQERQLTTLGKNIHALEVDGSFDDCQQMVKQAFADKSVNDKLFLTSANSINIARWLPQQFYYFFAYKQWADKKNPPVISVPSGNFGNICAGLLAMQSGLPVKHFVAACNINDIVSSYLQTGKPVPKQSVSTLSNAMDVGNPSNLIRIPEIFHNQFPELKKHLSAYTISEEKTLETIKKVYRTFNYMLEPHGAVGYAALENYLASHQTDAGIFLETAHPVKFPEAAQQCFGKQPEMPVAVQSIMGKEKKSVLISNTYAALKDFLLK